MSTTASCVMVVIAAMLSQAEPRPVPSASPSRPLSPAADLVQLRDGAFLLGWVDGSSSRGKTRLVARRAWLREHAESRFPAWEAREAERTKLAQSQRRERLQTWKQQRSAEANDPIVAWIDRELARLVAEPNREWPLMRLELEFAQVARVVRRPAERTRMLRQAWRAGAGGQGLDNPEEMSLDDLRGALEARGFAQSDLDPAAVDDLLPLAEEPEAQWLLRRAATEVKVEPGLRFSRYQGLLIPEESTGGVDVSALAAPAANLARELLGLGAGGAEADPLVARGREIAARGRVGLVTTSLLISEDLAAVKVESVLWVRQPATDRWAPLVRCPTIARPDRLPAGGAQAVEMDPTVNSVFSVVEGLGLGAVSPEMKRRAAGIGAATQQALGQARQGLKTKLKTWELPIGP